MKCPECDKNMDQVGYHTYRCEGDKLTMTLEYDGDYE